MNKRHCPPFCTDHQLVLTNPHKHRYDVVTSFCPKYHREPRLPEQTYPVFNFDCKYFTSAFILEVDRRGLERNESQELA